MLTVRSGSWGRAKPGAMVKCGIIFMIYERESGGSGGSVRFVGLFTGLVRLQDSHSPGPREMLRGRFTWGGSHDPILGGEHSKAGRKFESSGVGSPWEVHSTLALGNTEIGGRGSSLQSHATHHPSLSMGHSGN